MFRLSTYYAIFLIYTFVLCAFYVAISTHNRRIRDPYETRDRISHRLPRSFKKSFKTRRTAESKAQA